MCYLMTIMMPEKMPCKEKKLATVLGCPPRLLVLRAFRATAPAELQELLPDEGVVAPDDPVMQELAPLVAAVHKPRHNSRYTYADLSRPYRIVVRLCK